MATKRFMITCAKFASKSCDFIKSHKEVFLNDKEPRPRTLLGFTEDGLFVVTDGHTRDQICSTNFVWIQTTPVKHKTHAKSKVVKVLKEESKVTFILHKR